jgi:hypothetical protein
MKHRGYLSLVIVGLVMFLLGVLVASPPQELRALAPSAKATPTINKRMNANQVDNVHAAKTPVKNRLLALDENAKFPLSVIPQGQGSNLDADKLDGHDSSSFILSNQMGLARAGAFAYCDQEDSILFRSFNNVTSATVTIASGEIQGMCTIDFGFDLTDAYIIASPGGPACLNAVRSVDIEEIIGTKVKFETEFCGDSARNIFVIVY